MNNKIREIKEYIEEHIDEEGQIEETENFDDIKGLIDYVNKKADCKIKLKKCGGFDSPGYEIKCYAWAGIIDGELYFDSVEQECY